MVLYKLAYCFSLGVYYSFFGSWLSFDVFNVFSLFYVWELVALGYYIWLLVLVCYVEESWAKVMVNSKKISMMYFKLIYYII